MYQPRECEATEIFGQQKRRFRAWPFTSHKSFDSIIIAQSEEQKMGSVFVITNPICFQINKHITKMLQKQEKRFDAFAWIM
jgi:hypothetical protein